jgi:anti-sigma factor RsiW
MGGEAMTACPDHILLINGLLDDELDAANVVKLEMHLATCAGCSETLRRLQTVRDAMSAPELRYAAPASLRSRIEDTTSAPAVSPPPPGRLAATSWFAGGAISALAASLALMFALPRTDQPNLEGQLVSSHVRSLLAQHLVDIPTSNQHVVRPWFNGKTDYTPPAPELSDLGFPLVGGRLDVIDGRVVPTVVYRRRLHTINLFVLPAGTDAGGKTARLDGYSLIEWSQGGLRFAAVSDIDAGDLAQFRQAFASRSPR